MSHPWAPQANYLYLQARTMGPVVQPMGFGSYTTGSFEAKSAWAVPGYVASEPSGLHGLGAADTGCVTAEQAAQALVPALRVAFGAVTYRLPSSVPSLGGKPAGELLQQIPDSALIDLLSQGVSAAASAARKGRGALKNWLKGFLKKAVSTLPGGSQIASVGGFVAQTLGIGDMWDVLAEQIVDVLMGDLLKTEICTAVDTPTAPKPIIGSLLHDPSKPLTLGVQNLTAFQQGYAAEQARQAAALRRTPTVAPAQKKSSTPLLIGAAALAALMFMK